MTASSSIRVFVQWKEQTVFAGEDVECKITFKNIAPSPGTPRVNVQSPKSNGFVAGGERQRRTVPLHAVAANNRSISQQNARMSPSQTPGHKPALSLSVPSSSRRQRSPGSWSAGQNGASGHAHKRSVSIISMGSDVTTEENQGPNSAAAARRPGRNHTRSASLQVLPRMAGPSSPSGYRSATQPSPLFNASFPPTNNGRLVDGSLPIRPSRRPSAGPPTTPNAPGMPQFHRKSSGSISQTFKFPATSPQMNTQSPDLPPPAASGASPKRAIGSAQGLSPYPPEEGPSGADPVPKVISGSSMNGTPRSSGEFYSMSNNSSETLASEYTPQVSARLLSRPTHVRRGSNLSVANSQKPPEILMMGYAQIMGSFTLDGSLVNQAPFEEVKRKGVVGGQGGGGVVGVERSSRESGLFGALGWGSIGESLGGLLSGGELSSIKEMRGIASSKTIPLISTPQSVLFVDLRLKPGESKTYSYSFTLPKSLPPTHKGKTIKISYSLVIGTQRPGTSKDQQQVKQIDIPFRVFGGVNGRGEILGHDLMCPYIILRDEARTESIDENLSISSISFVHKRKKGARSQDSSLQDFLSYADTLIDQPRQNLNAGLLSPTEHVPKRRLSSVGGPSSIKEAIDLAVLRSNIATSSNRSTNRFEIARNGRRVAVLMIARPAYRLGETITAVIDFSKADVPCYALHAALETSEKVDPAIALRSANSIHRVTRRIHSTRSETTLFARRVTFSPTIPANATPEFITTGVSLEWKIRVEFVTPRISGEEEDEGGGESLLEEVARDERGVTLAAIEGMFCESFEIAVPITVYGAAAGDTEGAATEGLAV
ncbi:MAG: hypothetical protein M1819_007427 [Sarea resinae]|nr:MAG: hypothetical protein M1819_007427 [Sarea resinae]